MLIEKAQVNDPCQEISMKKLLDDITGTIKPNKPAKSAKHNLVNLFEENNKVAEPANSKSVVNKLNLVSGPSVAKKLKSSFESPFAPPTLKQSR